jgi:hypothetical protein
LYFEAEEAALIAGCRSGPALIVVRTDAPAFQHGGTCGEFVGKP